MAAAERRRRACLQALTAAATLSLAPALSRAQSPPGQLTLQQMTAPLTGGAVPRHEGDRKSVV